MLMFLNRVVERVFCAISGPLSMPLGLGFYFGDLAVIFFMALKVVKVRTVKLSVSGVVVFVGFLLVVAGISISSLFSGVEDIVFLKYIFIGFFSFFVFHFVLPEDADRYLSYIYIVTGSIFISVFVLVFFGYIGIQNSDFWNAQRFSFIWRPNSTGFFASILFVYWVHRVMGRVVIYDFFLGAGILVALLSTMSVGSLISAFLGFFVYLTVVCRWRVIFVFAVVSFFAYVFLYFGFDYLVDLMPSRAYDRIQQIRSLVSGQGEEVGSSNIRLEMAKGALNYFLNNPVLGIGFTPESVDGIYPHVFPLMLAYNGGIASVLGYFIIIFGFSISIVKGFLRKDLESSDKALVIAVFVCWVVNSLGHTHMYQLHFWILLILVIQSRETLSKPSKSAIIQPPSTA